MNKIIIFAVSFFAASAAWTQQASTTSQSASIETINADSVPIEEYVPKVIIEGKWGTGPGEFGAIDPMQAEYFKVSASPGSMAVNSKGEIYILDHLNSRIQKFSSDGKFRRLIAILSCADDKDESIVKIEKLSAGGARFGLEKAPAITGINIAIDSEDKLYYYFKRIKGGKETGEVWEFKNDKLLRKFPGRIPEAATRKNIRKEVVVKNRTEKEIIFGDSKGRNINIKSRKGENFFDDISARKQRISNKVRMEKDGLISVVCEENAEVWTNYYTEGGELIKRFRWKSRPTITTDISDANRNMYLPGTTENGFKVTKYELRVTK